MADQEQEGKMEENVAVEESDPQAPNPQVAAPEATETAGTAEAGAEQPKPVEEEQISEVKEEESAPKEPVESAQDDNADTGGAVEDNKDANDKVEPQQPPTEEVEAASSSKDPTATVKLQLIPSSDVITVAFSLHKELLALRDELAQELQVSSSLIKITHGNNEVDLNKTLKDLDVLPNNTIEFELSSTDPGVSLKPFQAQKQLDAQDFITVRVVKANNELEDIVVAIERQATKKPFLGGFRHKLSGTQYHHAAAQTSNKQIKVSSVERFNRECQTVFERNQSQQTTNTTSTQMPKTGCYISAEHDKLIAPKKYTTYEEYMKRRIEAVIRLQSYFRRWQARHLVEQLKLDRDRRIEWERQEEIRKRKEKEERIKREFEKRINPKTREDFDLLYAALEKWRVEELGHINDEFTGAERKAALCALLEQETQLIGSIDKRKIEAYKDGKEKNIMKFLDKTAAPKRWKAYDGMYTEMDTKYTIRAKELRDIYSSINMKYLTQDERLDILLTLKHTVKEHDCKLTREITELIDREADLLMRGMKETNLEGLRKRISTLFLQYCSNPLFNPEAARLLKVPQDPSTLRKDIYFCASANQYLPSTEFNLTSSSRVVGKCRKVQQLDNEACTRQDFSHYRIMLKELRQAEEGYKDNSKIAYLIQQKDLQYLVENIWGAQSILSSWDDLYDLVLVRWDKDEEWSPWNTILLTKDEAAAHNRLDHLEEAYSKQFISKVLHKHTLSRVHFVKLPGMSEVLRKKTSGSQRLPGPKQIEGVNVLNAY